MGQRQSLRGQVFIIPPLFRILQLSILLICSDAGAAKGKAFADVPVLHFWDDHPTCIGLVEGTLIGAKHASFQTRSQP